MRFLVPLGTSQVFFDYQYSESGRSANMPVSTMAALAIGESGPVAAFGGLNLEPLFSSASTSPYELSLALADIGGHLTAKWTFQSDIFSAATIEKMAQV